MDKFSSKVVELTYSPFSSISEFLFFQILTSSHWVQFGTSTLCRSKELAELMKRKCISLLHVLIFTSEHTSDANSLRVMWVTSKFIRSVACFDFVVSSAMQNISYLNVVKSIDFQIGFLTCLKKPLVVQVNIPSPECLS